MVTRRALAGLLVALLMAVGSSFIGNEVAAQGNPGTGVTVPKHLVYERGFNDLRNVEKVGVDLPQLGSHHDYRRDDGEGWVPQLGAAEVPPINLAVGEFENYCVQVVVDRHAYGLSIDRSSPL